MFICTDCQPAGISVPQLDDLGGRCEACGQRDGNLRRYTPSTFVAQQGHYVTATGRIIAVQTMDTTTYQVGNRVAINDGTGRTGWN